MNARVHSFLTELYEIDPALREHEAELAGLIEALLEHDPGMDPDARFVEMLRVKLRERSAQLDSSSRTSFFPSFFMPKFSYGIVGALLGILVTGPAVFYLASPSSVSPSPSTGNGDLFAFKVTPVSRQAFGDLSTVQSAGGMGGARTQSGGGGGSPEIDAAMPPQPTMMEADGDVANSKMMIYPPDYTFNQFNYVYKGEDFELPSGDVSVLKRVKGTLSIPGLNALASADLGVFSMSAFPNLKLDTVSAYQTSKDGYSIYVSLREGSVNISQNWETWNHPEANCTTEACYQSFRIKASDVPSDDVLVGIADDFLKDFGFNLKNVGTPYVDDGWRVSYENMEDKSQFWIPDQISVVYPFQIDGMEAYEEFGGKAGVSVSINIRDKKVAGVWNLFDQSYESSTYPAVSDKQKVLDYLSNFERMDIMPFAAGAENAPKVETVDVELGTPTMGLVRMYKYDNGTSDELFVPALVFPVTKQPEGKNLYYSRQTVTVPLAQELFDRSMQNRPMPVDGPMFRTMDGGGTDSAVSNPPADDAATSDIAE